MSASYMATLQRLWHWEAAMAKCAYCREAGIKEPSASAGSQVEMIFTPKHEKLLWGKVQREPCMTSNAKKDGSDLNLNFRSSLSPSSCKLNQWFDHDQKFPATQHDRIFWQAWLRWLCSTSEVIKTIPEVIRWCPCHFLYPHLNFLFVCAHPVTSCWSDHSQPKCFHSSSAHEPDSVFHLLH